MRISVSFIKKKQTRISLLSGCCRSHNIPIWKKCYFTYPEYMFIFQARFLSLKIGSKYKCQTGDFGIAVCPLFTKLADDIIYVSEK